MNSLLMRCLLSLTISYATARQTVNDDDVRDLLHQLDSKPKWNENEMKLYLQVTIAINFSQSQT